MKTLEIVYRKTLLLLISSTGNGALASSPRLFVGSNWVQGSLSGGQGSWTTEEAHITAHALRESRCMHCSGTTSRPAQVFTPCTGLGECEVSKGLFNLDILKTASYLEVGSQCYIQLSPAFNFRTGNSGKSGETGSCWDPKVPRVVLSTLWPGAVTCCKASHVPPCKNDLGWH